MLYMQEFLSSVEQKNMKNDGNQTVRKTKQIQRQPASIWLPTFFNIFFWVQQKKEMHTGLVKHEDGTFLFGGGGGGGDALKCHEPPFQHWSFTP